MAICANGSTLAAWNLFPHLRDRCPRADSQHLVVMVVGRADHSLAIRESQATNYVALSDIKDALECQRAKSFHKFLDSRHLPGQDIEAKARWTAAKLIVRFNGYGFAQPYSFFLEKGALMVAARRSAIPKLNETEDSEADEAEISCIVENISLERKFVVRIKEELTMSYIEFNT